MAIHIMGRTIIQVTTEVATMAAATTAAATTEVDIIMTLIMEAVIMISSWDTMTCTTAARSYVDSLSSSSS